MTALEVDSLTVRFDTTLAVNDCSLTLSAGEVLALVGPSGCGKSSLLRAIAGLVAPDSGRVLWDSEDITSLAPHRRDFGLMFQDHALFNHRTVGQNVGFGLKMQGISRNDSETRVAELLTNVGLADFGDRSVDSLSGGEAQRVALARALAPRPRLLLLDEPLASLDRLRREELLGLLAMTLRSEHQTAIFVTHDQEEAFAIADRVAVMQAGSILRVASPAELWRDPRSRFVAEFVGHGPIIEVDGEPAAVRRDAAQRSDGSEGAFVAEVVECRFQGDRSEITAEDAAGRRWTILTADAAPLGASIEVMVDESKIIPLAQ